MTNGYLAFISGLEETKKGSTANYPKW